MDFINSIHTIGSALAVISGAIVLLRPKGTRFHVRTGYFYLISMMVCLFTSFFIFDLFGGFGVFHVMTIVSLVTLGLGMWYPIFGRRFKNWAIHHYMWMSYSYIGLIMAGGSHLFGVVPEWPWWLRMLLFWGLPYGVGSLLIFRNRRKILREVRERTGLDILVR